MIGNVIGTGRYSFSDKSHMKITPCWVWVLCVYAGTISGAFIGVTVLGVLHLNELTERCAVMNVDGTFSPTEGKSTLFQTLDGDSSSDIDNLQHHRNNMPKRYTLKDDYLDVTELVEIDVTQGEVIFYFSATVETQSGVAFIDYHKHLGAFHISGGMDRCYLVKDIDLYFPDVVSLNTFLESGKPAEQHKATVNLDYEVSNLDDPEEHMDSIPRALHNMCWGKTIYWLRQVAAHDDRQAGREVIAVITTEKTTLFISVRE